MENKLKCVCYNVRDIRNKKLKDEVEPMKFNGLIPELSVSNIEKSKWFYIEVLGFKLEYEREADNFVFVSLEEAQIMLEEINGHWATGELNYPFGRGINFEIGVKNIESLINRLKKAEISFFRDPMVNKYPSHQMVISQKEFLVQDPDGYLLRFSEDPVQEA